MINASDLADTLGVKESTLRKYSLLIEKQGYLFSKTELGQRQYTDKDVEVFRNLLEAKQQTGVTLEEASKRVVLGDNEEAISGLSLVEKEENESIISNAVLLAELKKLREESRVYQEKQQAFNKKLVEKLEEQNQYIENSITKRDQVTIDSLQLSLATRRLTSKDRRKKRSGIVKVITKIFTTQ